MNSDWKPRLSRSIKISENGDTIVLNQREYGYQLKLKKDFKYILLLMDGSRTIEQLKDEYEIYFGRSISSDALDKFIKERLQKNGFLEGVGNLKTRNSQAFLKAKFVIIKKGILEKIYHPNLNFIFEGQTFYSILFILFSANFYIFTTHLNIDLNSKSWLIFLILFICHLFHEVGHAMAAKAKQSSPGNIGFGFYFILPVFFVDLSDIWNIPKKDRIIVNLSGIFFDYLIGLCFGILFFISKNSLFLIIQIILFTKTFYNLNPVIRSDAYWVISDAFDKPNLYDNLTLEVRLLIKRLFNKKTENNWKPNVALLIYGFLTICFWVFVIYNILIKSKTFTNDINELHYALKQAIFFNKWNVSIIIAKAFQILFFSFAFYFLFRLIAKWVIFLSKKRIMVWQRA